MSSKHVDRDERTDVIELPSSPRGERSVFGFGLFRSEGRIADLTVLTFLFALVGSASAAVAMVLI